MNIEIVLLFAVQGFLLGLQAGLAPGPLTTLVISESLQHGRGAGMRCSVAPLLSDPPIVAFSLLLLASFAGAPWVVRTISLVGGIFLGWLAWESLRVRAAQFEKPSAEGRTLLKAVGVNLLNPNPYIYWTTIGASLVLKAASKSIAAAIVFIVLFYVALVGTKAVMAVVAGGARHRLNAGTLVWANRIVGVAMLAFAVVLLAQGIWGFELFGEGECQ